MNKHVLRIIGILASLATILSVCIAAIALVPAFGQWLSPHTPVTNSAATTAPQPTATVQQVAQQPTPTSQPTTQISAPPTSIPPTATQAPLVTTYEVFANLSWQDTGVQIKSDDRLRIIWDGKSKWRGINYGDFSDPLGGYSDLNANYDCPPLTPSEEAGWNALVAKIGANGIPSNPFKVIPSGEGNLYLAMNDCDKQRYDNEGSVIVTIEVQH